MKPQIVTLNPSRRSARRAFVNRIEDIAPLDTVPGEQVSICVRGADVGGAYTILQSLIIPGAAVPTHMHRNEDKVFHIIEGCLRFQIGKAEFDAVKGDCRCPQGLRAWMAECDRGARIGAGHVLTGRHRPHVRRDRRAFSH